MLISDLNVRIINAATGELIRELTINPTRDYQPRGVKPGPKKTRTLIMGSGYSDVPTHHMVPPAGFEPD